MTKIPTALYIYIYKYIDIDININTKRKRESNEKKMKWSQAVGRRNVPRAKAHHERQPILFFFFALLCRSIKVYNRLVLFFLFFSSTHTHTFLLRPRHQRVLYLKRWFFISPAAPRNSPPNMEPNVTTAHFYWGPFSSSFLFLFLYSVFQKKRRCLLFFCCCCCSFLFTSAAIYSRIAAADLDVELRPSLPTDLDDIRNNVRFF